MSLIGEIWSSFRRMPLWVQVWVAFLLVPVNLLPLMFLWHDFAIPVAVLSVGGMVLNLPIMLADRGFSKRMALPHVCLWSPLIILLVWLLSGDRDLANGYRAMLLLVLATDLASLGFDYPDLWKWWRGDRDIA